MPLLRIGCFVVLLNVVAQDVMAYPAAWNGQFNLQSIEANSSDSGATWDVSGGWVLRAGPEDASPQELLLSYEIGVLPSSVVELLYSFFVTLRINTPGVTAVAKWHPHFRTVQCISESVNESIVCNGTAAEWGIENVTALLSPATIGVKFSTMDNTVVYVDPSKLHLDVYAMFDMEVTGITFNRSQCNIASMCPFQMEGFLIGQNYILQISRTAEFASLEPTLFPVMYGSEEFIVNVPLSIVMTFQTMYVRVAPAIDGVFHLPSASSVFTVDGGHPDHCLDWRGATECVECFDFFYLMEDGSCAADCPQGTIPYSGSPTTLCQACPADCATCAYDSACVACHGSEVVQPDGRCGPDTGRECEDPGCVDCDDAGVPCRVCLDGLFLTAGGTCASSCPLGQFPSGAQCARCAVECEICEERAVCSRCANGYVMSTAGECVFSCPSGETVKGDDSRACEERDTNAISSKTTPGRGVSFGTVVVILLILQVFACFAAVASKLMSRSDKGMGGDDAVALAPLTKEDGDDRPLETRGGVVPAVEISPSRSAPKLDIRTPVFDPELLGASPLGTEDRIALWQSKIPVAKTPTSKYPSVDVKTELDMDSSHGAPSRNSPSAAGLSRMPSEGSFVDPQSPSHSPAPPSVFSAERVSP